MAAQVNHINTSGEEMPFDAEFKSYLIEEVKNDDQIFGLHCAG